MAGTKSTKPKSKPVKESANKAVEEPVEVVPEGDIDNLDQTRSIGKTVRIITGSYEHNLFCTALTLSEKSEIFTPIFHFTPHTASIRCLAASKRHLVSGSNDENIRLYDLQKRKEVGTLMEHTGPILCLDFYRSKWLFSGGGDGQICLWRTKDWELLGVLRGHKGPVNDLSVHDSGKIALSVSEDKQLILWNTMTGRKASGVRLREKPFKVQWVPNSNNYIIGYEHSIAFYLSSEPKWARKLDSPLQQLRSWNEYLVLSYNNGKIDFFKWSELSEDSKPEFTLHGHATRVKDFSIIDNFMSSVSSDGKIVVWDLEKRDQVAVHSSNDRYNCTVMVPDEIEEDLKRPMPHADTDNETDGEEVHLNEQRKKKKKKAKVIIEH